MVNHLFLGLVYSFEEDFNYSCNSEIAFFFILFLMCL